MSCECGLVVRCVDLENWMLMVDGDVMRTGIVNENREDDCHIFIGEIFANLIVVARFYM